MTDLSSRRQHIRKLLNKDEAEILANLRELAPVSDQLRQAATARAEKLVLAIRNDSRPGLMEVFLAEYGLSTEEGVALMCLAEALLRVPDADTIDALIEDKIAPSAWGKHLGHSSSSLVNASTWALMLTGKVLKEEKGVASTLRGAVKRLGEPVIRVAVKQAIREMGRQFVLGQTIDEAISNGKPARAKGYTYSYDMLGEAALTARDARDYFTAYSGAIARLASQCTSDDIRANPGISIKLSALHPRFEFNQRERVLKELTGRVLALAVQAKSAGMGLNIDAEEADRLDLTLDIVEAVLRDGALANWDGFGVVVQAYGKRAAGVIDWLHGLAEAHDTKIMVRLVKGAYWDSEIKRAQVEGLRGFPVFTRKSATDASYICCARLLLDRTDRIYPQFATHNAHTVAAILAMQPDPESFEFQRLHGMGEALHDLVLANEKSRCRIYAPVGAHRDLLAYLVRRLLENGANSSFVNQIVNEDVPASEVAADPFERLGSDNPAVVAPADLYQPERINSRGWELREPDDLTEVDCARLPFRDQVWTASPMIAGAASGGQVVRVFNPADPVDHVGDVTMASAGDVEMALAAAKAWDAPAAVRVEALTRAADLYEANFGEVFALLTREAGKTLPDAVAELREAVDFLRYYAARGTGLTAPARGIITCISPWNFPLAIFTGQIAAALAAGNGVVAKPAETTSLVAALAVKFLHEAGVPLDALQLLPGFGQDTGALVTSDARIDGVCFTGSTTTAQAINRSMADNLAPTAPLVAETGGLNAMIVDSTALPDQAIRDIVNSAFLSAGQRCSALRMLYVQQDVGEAFLTTLYGAMDELKLGNPWDVSTDIGPAIDMKAAGAIQAHVDAADREGRLLKQLAKPATGSFVGPAVIRVGGIADLEKEVFGPVLHVATYRADELDDVVAAINETGYGLTFGMHSRIDDRVEAVTSALKIGNIYVNRDQIGAIVGSQPFGGEGLSGTGPKAGGPSYLMRFTQPQRIVENVEPGKVVAIEKLQAQLDRLASEASPCLLTKNLPGPTGESNHYSVYGRGTILCLGPTLEAANSQAKIAQANGCAAVIVAPGALQFDGRLDAGAIQSLRNIDGVALWADDETLRPYRQFLAKRDGQLIPLLAEDDMAERCRLERHLCVDTTAAGGNASLLAKAS